MLQNQKEKTIRRMQTRDTAQKIIDALRVHYNFVRIHQTLKKTPAQKLDSIYY